MDNNHQGKSKGNILIVDDRPDNLRLLSRMLNQEGYKVRPVTNGAQALAAARSTSPDLVLLDIMMPEMDGYEVCERLKADEQTRDIPVLFISALDEAEDKVRAFAAGGVDYITKPFQIAEVSVRVKTHLALQSLQKQLQEQNARLEAQNAELHRLSQAIEQSANMVVITDLEGTIEYANPKFAEITGYSLEEALGQNPRILKSGAQDDDFYKNLWETITSGREWHGEFLNKRQDGSLYWEQASISPIYDATGQMTHFVAVKEDISDRKQAEEALNKLLELNRVLATTRDMNQVLTQAVTEAVEIIPGADRGTLQWLGDDGQALNTVAYSHADDTQRPVLWPGTGNHIPFQSGVGAAGQAFASQQIINMPDVLADERFVPGDPPARFRSLLVAPLVAKDRPLGTLSLTSEKTGAFSLTDEALIGLIADQIAAALENASEFTARSQAEVTLQQHIAELKSRNEELDAFAHTVAHDLKNPASVMVGYADLLRRGRGKLSETLVTESLATISRQGRKMSTIVDELLLLASVRAMTEIEIEPLEMQQIITESLVDLRFLTEEYQGEIIVPETWPVALGYAPWVGVMWTNYISNALKYGGEPPRVELGATILEDGWVRFWVHDNGDGLSPDEQSRLFTPFERLHREGIQGHGLGLSIVQRIAQKLEGRVGVESEGTPGQGSIFFFTLPGRPADEA